MKKLTAWIDGLEPWKKIMGVIAILLTAYFGVTQWVRKTAQDAVLDEKFLAIFAARVRPSCIFNTRGAIESDLGAMEFIEDVHALALPSIYGYEVTVKPKRHLVNAPLISCLDAALYQQSATRGKRYEWVVVLSPQSTVTGVISEDPMNTNTVHRFKLEILH